MRTKDSTATKLSKSGDNAHLTAADTQPGISSLSETFQDLKQREETPRRLELLSG